MKPSSTAPAPGVDWRWILPRLLLALPLLQLYATLATLRPPGESDYYLLYVHAEMARANERLYWPWPEYGPHFGAEGLRFPPDRIFYPPFLTPALSFFSGFGVERFAQMWITLLWAAYWAYAACLAKLSTGRITFLATMTWGLGLFVLTGRAAQSAINLGNVDPIIWALFGAALAYPAMRGVGFMAIALVKVYGVWPLIFAGIARERKTIRAAASTLLAGFLVAATALGPVTFVRECLGWLQHMLPVMGQGTFSRYNVSISFFFLRVARWLGWSYVAGPLGPGPRLYLTAMGVAAPLIAGWLLRRQEPRLRYAGIVCAAVFFGPLAWNFYTPLLLAPLAVWLGGRRRVDEEFTR